MDEPFSYLAPSNYECAFSWVTMTPPKFHYSLGHPRERTDSKFLPSSKEAHGQGVAVLLPLPESFQTC